MTDFTEAQDLRDRYATLDGVIGDECRRWLSCTRCGWNSPEHRYMWERDAIETDHELYGCTPPPVPVAIDVDLNLWAYPSPMFTHRLEPLTTERTVPARTRFDPVPYPKWGKTPVIYTDIPKEAA